ncbi:MAG: hypothetical protein IKF00_10910 [Solobacterium sp.]|nr:hypothetical protein [Solobacterium sp.]MBR3343399.1 hypothetical protein [Solobacterium sp.]HAE16074.1 hypothetical protein [Erysipelotrichaceae bacterium]
MMTQSIAEYLGELEIALIELQTPEREDALDDVYALISEMRDAGDSDRMIIRKLGPVKKVARDYLRKYGKGSSLSRITENFGSFLTQSQVRSAPVQKQFEYYLRFYDGGKYKIGLQDLRPLGKLEVYDADIYRLYSPMSEYEIVRFLQRLGLNDREYELVNPRTGESF